MHWNVPSVRGVLFPATVVASVGDEKRTISGFFAFFWLQDAVEHLENICKPKLFLSFWLI
jgi:hypothetical protein